MTTDGTPMFGLSVRWSLATAPDDTAGKLRRYVADESLDRFAGRPGLRFKTWRMRAGEWFEGTYVFGTARARDEFHAAFTEQAPTAPGTRLIGSPPVLMERFEVVAVAEGGDGFTAGVGPGSA